MFQKPGKTKIQPFLSVLYRILNFQKNKYSSVPQIKSLWVSLQNLGRKKHLLPHRCWHSPEGWQLRSQP